ncbi:hypothetical protein RESH_00040 [Rhodopirellula europaea SH398]|uniref:Uncharacterized protein n=1 Tax=Rhodopirellula europaea SH398 TaxID=1263868 RepID=M5SCV3_9BACT|nr:hypothetical protein RESH_00040 [Rhodopirellula europaea SH398]
MLQIDLFVRLVNNFQSEQRFNQVFQRYQADDAAIIIADHRQMVASFEKDFQQLGQRPIVPNHSNGTQEFF